MKKVWLASAFLITTGRTVRRQVTAGKVQAAITTGFARKLSSVTPAWGKDNSNFDADIMQAGCDPTCVADNKGTILEAETGITLPFLPEPGQDDLKMHTGGGKTKKALIIMKQGKDDLYEATLPGREIMFDDNGNFLTEIK